MIEIIPNWHPFFVHFTVGLLSTAVLFYWASAFLSNRYSWKQQWLTMANWCLWTGCLFAIATATAGWIAYNSVAHDAASHTAMTVHRNWALPTAGIFLLLGLWAIILANKKRRPGFLFLIFSLTAVGMLSFTGWLGSEAVYRYGLGVKSLPVVEEGTDGHSHNHSHSSMHDHNITESEPMMSSVEDHSLHNHADKITPTENDPTFEATAGHSHKTSAASENHIDQHSHSPDETLTVPAAVEKNTKTSEKNTIPAGHHHTHKHDDESPAHHHH